MTKVFPWIVVAVAIAFAAARRRRKSGGATQPSRRRVDWPSLQSTAALIAAREIRQRIRGRLFRVVTVLMLLGVGAAIIIPALTKGGASTTKVGIVGTLSPTARSAVLSAGATADTHVVLLAEPSIDAARTALKDGRIGVAVTANAVVTQHAISAGDGSTTARLVHTLAVSLGAQRAFQAANLTKEQQAELTRSRPLPLQSLQPSRPKGTAQSIAVIGVIVLFIMLTQYNTWTLMGVMEEKSSRVVEVLLATVRPMQLLAGKVLGIGLLVLGQAALVVGFALGVAAAVGSDVLHGAGPTLILSILAWLVLGYAFYSWVYAAIGSMAERQDQVQSLAVPVTIPLVFGYVFALGTASHGSASTFFHVLAYLPPTAPFAMPVLVALHDVRWWQFVVSLVVTLISTVGVARLAAYVYRRAVLRTGRRVTLREVFTHQTG